MASKSKDMIAQAGNLEKLIAHMTARREHMMKEMVKGGEEGVTAATRANSAKNDIATLQRIVKRVSDGIYD